MKDLTTTSYAILGLLSVRPWSAYDLSKQMKRSLAFYWPRAERAIYDEPKTLVAHGMATATVEPRGKRSRTVYAITPKGRRALSRWLAQPCAPPQFESEALLHAAFAERGSKEDLLAAVRSVWEHAQVLRAQGEEVARDYLEDRGPFPQRLHVIALTGQFNVSYIAMLEQWSAWAEDVVEHWPDTSTPAVYPDALDVFRSFLGEDATPRRSADRATG